MSKTAELQIEDVYFTLIDALSNSRDYLFFIQVGSNDSRTGDPATYGDPLQSFLKNEHWHGIMIEPVGYVFDRLLAKYSGVERLILENIAIAETNGTKDFYITNYLIML